jgi:two-component system chemotaxis sensor kinase CheA
MNPKVFDTLLEPTFVINSEKKVVYCNEPAALICDSTPRKISRQTPFLDQLLVFAEPLTGLDTLTALQEPSAYQEVGFKTESGREGKVQVTIQPLSEVTAQSEGRWLVYFRDVTLEETLQKKYRGELEQKESYILDLQKARDELKNYSENLEKMVEARTKEIMSLNQTMRALLDSLTQGFFIFEPSGVCLPVYSKSCEHTLQGIPAGKNVWDVLKLPEKSVPGFKRWLPTLFSEMLPFKDLAPLGPQTFPHSDGRIIQLDYYPVRNAQGAVTAVVVVSTDITELVVAQREAEVEKSQSKMILALVRNKMAASAFVRESRSMLAGLLEELKNPEPAYDSVFRLLHTLKGAMGSFHVRELQQLCHQAENVLADWNQQFEPAPKAMALQKLASMAHQLEKDFAHFIETNQYLFGRAHASHSAERWIEFPISSGLEFIQKFNLQPEVKDGFIESLLEIPIQQSFTQFEEVAKQIAEQEGKTLSPLEFLGGDLKIPPEPYENLFSSLTHAYRNAVDHGIERPEVRAENGKPESGRITTRFEAFEKNQKTWLKIEIQDDGGGINPAVLREKLSKKGLSVEQETDHQVIQHVFDSSFSTKEVVTETSGRGVGMDAIQESAKALGGQAEVFSLLGQGSTLVVCVPTVNSVSWYIEHFFGNAHAENKKSKAA